MILTAEKIKENIYTSLFTSFRNTRHDSRKAFEIFIESSALNFEKMLLHFNFLGANGNKNIEAELLEKITEKYLKNLNQILALESRLASAHVVGPARFPAKKMEKLSLQQQNKYQYFANWLEKLSKKTFKNQNNFIRDSDNNAVERLKEKIKTKKGSQKYQLKKRLEYVEKAKETETKFLEFKNFKVEKNFAENRIRFHFHEKPTEEKRNVLKRNGFKWSPKLSVWQNYINTNSLNFVEKQAQFLGE